MTAYLLLYNNGRIFGLLFLVQLKICSVEAFTKPCKASLQTVTNVAGCPTNDSSYEIAARQKNCPSLMVDSSRCKSFQYHCVLRDDLKAAIEVCAPSLNIIGHSCAMFSNKFRSIMRVDSMTCGDGTAGCPYSYNSTIAFKYQHCFPKGYQHYSTETALRSSSSKTTGRTRESSNDQSLIIANMTFTMIMVIIGIVLLILAIIRRSSKRRRQAMPRDYVDVEQPLLQTPRNDPDLGQESRQEEISAHVLDAFSSLNNKYPAYIYFKTRELSFKACQNRMRERGRDFAGDGFFYEGYGRVASCFHCGCTKYDWTDQDDIHSVHLDLNNTCQFVKYVESHLRKNK